MIQEVGLDLTTRCNLRCKHCLLDYSTSISHEFSLRDLTRIAQDLRKLSISVLEISGGEPCVRKDLCEILSVIRQYGIEPTLFTNGTLVNRDYAYTLSKLVKLVSTSIDGPPKYHDSFRGKKGSFEKTIQFLKDLREFNTPTALQYTVTPLNLKYLEWAAELAYDLGITIFRIAPIARIGRGAQIDAKYLFEENSYEMLYKQVLRLSMRYLEGMDVVTVLDVRDFAIKHPCRVFACYGSHCHSHSKPVPHSIIIRANGDVMPIDGYIDDSFKMGNVHDQALSTILMNYDKSPAHERLKRLCKHIFVNHIMKSQAKIFYWKELLYRESRNKNFQDYDIKGFGIKEEEPFISNIQTSKRLTSNLKISAEQITPTISNNVRIIHEGQKCIVTVKGKNAVLRINTNAEILLKLCDGKNTLHTIFQHMQKIGLSWIRFMRVMNFMRSNNIIEYSTIAGEKTR